MEIEVGQIIAGYEVVGQIGSGGMGKVYKVRNLISERIEALKILRSDSGKPSESAERFLREIKVQARFQHPNIAAFYSAVKMDDEILMFMEYVEGVGLDERLRRGPLGINQALSYARQCLGALEYAHHYGVIHRDIKPSNILVTPEGAVKLLDFGIARGEADLTLTGEGVALGSVHYMSPEQALGHPVDERSDLYSLGVTLYEMLTGVRPFTGPNAYAILKAHVDSEPAAPAALNPQVPAALSEVIRRAMAKKREDRYATAAVFRGALEAVATETAATTQFPPENLKGDAGAPAGVDSTTTRLVANCLAAEVGPIAFHLVKQAQTSAHNVHELCMSVASQVPHESARHRFLEQVERELRLPALSLSMTTAKVGTPAASNATAARPLTWDTAVLDRVKKELAAFVGPVAKVIVDRTARKTRTIDQLYTSLAEEIESPADRTRFLASKPK